VIGIVVEYGRFDPAGVQEPRHDLAYAPEPGDDDRAGGRRLVLARFIRNRQARRQKPVVQHQEKRCGQHRQRDRERDGARSLAGNRAEALT